MKFIVSSFVICLLTLCFSCQSEPQEAAIQADSVPSQSDTLSKKQTLARVQVGAERLLTQLNQLKNKQVAVVANHTSILPNGTHLVDTLLAAGIRVTKVFSPEHGFRGTADAGAKVKSQIDTKTGLPLISLYGNNKKPTASQLAGLDLVVFDLQDVGVRLYTYISTLTYVMEACAEAHIPVIVLDRPNPNGWYVDGPVRKAGFQSFIGMHEIPVVHGMTIAEYAQMVNGEGWLENGVKADLTLIKCTSYQHDMRWEDTGLPWVAPSPNLGTPLSAHWYPALVWFETTSVSVGRGTDSAFTRFGAPWLLPAQFPDFPTGIQTQALTFTPHSLPGKSTSPKHMDVACPGFQFLRESPTDIPVMQTCLFMLEASYQQAKLAQVSFFKKGFDKWVGNNQVKQALMAGRPYASIYLEWQPEIEAFRQIRSQYLIYP